jgi:hypothetical protein
MPTASALGREVDQRHGKAPTLLTDGEPDERSRFRMSRRQGGPSKRMNHRGHRERLVHDGALPRDLMKRWFLSAGLDVHSL